MAVDGGYMKKHGVDAEYKIFPSGFEATVAVGAGEAQVANTDCPTVLKAKANGANFLLVARNILNPKELKFAVNASIHGPDDLKGKKVGVLKTSSVDWYASKYFKKFRLEEGTGPDQVDCQHRRAGMDPGPAARRHRRLLRLGALADQGPADRRRRPHPASGERRQSLSSTTARSSTPTG